VVDLDLLRSLGFMLLAAALFVLPAAKVRVPSIVAYIVAGLVLGPLTGLLSVDETIEIISGLGIALLLFVVGLELSLDKIRDLGRVALVAGLGQVIFTAAGGFALAMLLGFGVIEGVFIATALTFSSTVVVVKLLDQKKELHSLYGRIAVGIFLVQDLVVIAALTFLSGLGRPEALEAKSVLGGLAVAFAGMVLLCAAALLAARYFLASLFARVASSSDTLFIWSLCWCFLFVMAAEVMELSVEIGAFLAGVSLAHLPYSADLRRRVRPLMSFFIAVFFVSLGIQMELGHAAAHLGPAVVFSLFVLIGNPVIFLWIIARMGYGERTAFLTSVTVAQISEFSFIFAALGLSSGLIDETILSLIAVVGLLTIGASAFMIVYNHALYRLCRRLGLLRPFGARPEEGDEGRVEAAKPGGGLRGHIIVVGMNALGRRLVEELHFRGETTLAIDTDPAKLHGLPGRTLLGTVEYPSVLDEAGLEGAKLLVSALQIEDTNNLLAYRCREAGVASSIHVFDSSVARQLREIGIGYPMVSKNSGTKRILAELEARGVLRA
jgi:Kef-type K+ transport system membrane component KefB